MSASARIYLDYNATAPLRPAAAQALARAFELTGNASSVHAEGRAARGLVEAAREAVGALVGAQAKNVVFTSGGSEANNLVLAPGFRRVGETSGCDVLIVGAGEHASVLGGHRFPQDRVELLPLDARGVVDLESLAGRLAAIAPRRALVSLQLANSETGVIQPIPEAARIVRAHGGLLHSDAVQAAGKIPLDIGALGVDALTISAHKIGGPQGVGALVLASDGYVPERLVGGGGQERGWRAGTENVAGIAGFGAAAQAASSGLPAEIDRLLGLRAAFEEAIRRLAPETVIFGEGAQRLANTILFAAPGLKAQTALIALDLNGVALSSGSACSSGKVKRSHVLDAMGVAPALADAALRLSFGWKTTHDDVIRFAGACEKAFSTLYSRKACAA